MIGFDEPWQRVTAWLDANAVASAAEFRPPADEARLSTVRAVFDRPWPDDLVRLYQLCNGTGDASRHGARLFGLKTVVALDHMLRSRQTNLDVADEFPPEPGDTSDQNSTTDEPHDVWRWTPRLVPFARDVRGDSLFVDLRDGPAYGSVGSWVHDDNSTAAVWPSLTALFDGLADALESGSDWDGWTPVVVDDRLDWDA